MTENLNDFILFCFVSKKNEIKWGNEPTIVEMIWIFMTNKFMHFAAARSSSTERCRSVVDQHSTNINLMAAVVLPFSQTPQFIAFYFIFHKFPIFTVIGIGISVGNHFFSTFRRRWKLFWKIGEVRDKHLVDFSIILRFFRIFKTIFLHFYRKFDFKKRKKNFKIT